MHLSHRSEIDAGQRLHCPKSTAHRSNLQSVQLAENTVIGKVLSLAYRMTYTAASCRMIIRDMAVMAGAARQGSAGRGGGKFTSASALPKGRGGGRAWRRSKERSQSRRR
eukprot:6180487-Pleurochrysis_carterae.AAC.1